MNDEPTRRQHKTSPLWLGPLKWHNNCYNGNSSNNNHNNRHDEQQRASDELSSFGSGSGSRQAPALARPPKLNDHGKQM
jgi:hypothetical protein